MDRQPPGFAHSRAFFEIAIALEEGFREIGLRAPIVRDVEEIGGHGIALGCNLIPEFGMSNLPDSLIMFNPEQIQPDSVWMTPAYIDLLRSHPVYSGAIILGETWPLKKGLSTRWITRSTTAAPACSKPGASTSS